MQVLDENDQIDPKLFLILDTPDASTRIHRRLALLKEFPNMLLYGAPVTSIAQYTAKYQTSSTILSGDLPPNVHLLSLVAQEGYDTTILRLQHLFAAGEGALAAPINVDLSKIFAKLQPSNIIETSLTANQAVSVMHRPFWRTEDGPASEPTDLAAEVVSDVAPAVTLHARDLRTFVVSLKN